MNEAEKLRREYLAREEAILDERIRRGYSFKQGKQEGKKDDIINGLKEGFSVDVLSRITKISTKEIEAIKKELNL